MSEFDPNRPSSEAPSAPGLGFDPLANPDSTTNAAAPSEVNLTSGEGQAPDYSDPPPPYPGTDPTNPPYPPTSTYPPTSNAYPPGSSTGSFNTEYSQGANPHAGYNPGQYGAQPGQYGAQPGQYGAQPGAQPGQYYDWTNQQGPPGSGQPTVVHHHPPGSMAGQPLTGTTDGQTVVVIKSGNCPQCQVGVIVEDFTCAGLCLGIFFFPFGLICCLAMRDRHCNHCQTRF